MTDDLSGSISGCGAAAEGCELGPSGRRPAAADTDATQVTTPDESSAVSDALAAANAPCVLQLIPADDLPYGVAIALLRPDAETCERFPLTSHDHRQLASSLALPFDQYLRLLADYPELVIRRANNFLDQFAFVYLFNQTALQADDPRVEALVWEWRHHSRRASYDPLSRIAALECAQHMYNLAHGHSLESREHLPADLNIPRTSVLEGLEAIQHLLDPTAVVDTTVEAPWPAVDDKQRDYERLLDRVVAGVRRLKKYKHRELLLLMWADGLPLAEAAKHLHIPYQTAKSRHSKAMELLGRYNLVSRRDLEAVVREQDARERDAAQRIGRAKGGRNWDTQYKQPIVYDPSVRGTGPAPAPRYSAHPGGCRCTECLALRSDPSTRGTAQKFSAKPFKTLSPEQRAAVLRRLGPDTDPVVPYTAEQLEQLRKPAQADQSCCRKGGDTSASV